MWCVPDWLLFRRVRSLDHSTLLPWTFGDGVRHLKSRFPNVWPLRSVVMTEASLAEGRLLGLNPEEPMHRSLSLRAQENLRLLRGS